MSLTRGTRSLSRGRGSGRDAMPGRAQYVYRVLRKEETVLTLRRPASNLDREMHSLRREVIRHVSDGNQYAWDELQMLSTTSSTVCLCQVWHERMYLYGDKPVMIRIDLEQMSKSDVIYLGTDGWLGRGFYTSPQDLKFQCFQ